MRRVRPVIVGVVVLAVFLLGSGDESAAVPGAGGGTLFFSVRDIGAGDITPAVNAGGLTCTAADLLLSPASPNAPCALRPALPALAVPDAVTDSCPDFGLDCPVGAMGAFTDDIDALSYGELVGTGSVDFDFSVGLHPGQLGTTLGLACGPAPNVNSEATAVGGPEAQGDVFTTAGAPANCNTQNTDEAALGLVAPNGCAAGVRPCDDLDALADPVPAGGTCAVGGGAVPRICPVFSLSAFSGAFGGAPPVTPDALSALPPDEATILVPPGAPGSLGQPPGCPGPAPCAVLHSTLLGLVPSLGVAGAGDDIDALCWWDGNGSGVPDPPTVLLPGGGPGDYYLFSLSPGDPSVVGGLMFSPADILAPTAMAPFAPGPPVVVRTAASLGLRAIDNVDALICHDNDADSDGAPDLLDNCPNDANATQLDPDSDGLGNPCDDDDDGDGVWDSDEGECKNSTDDDGDTLVNDGCAAVGPEETDCADTATTGLPLDDDSDGWPNDGCPGNSEVNACGSDSLDSNSIPERLDGDFAGQDDDSDSNTDETLPGGSGGYDCDGDGWTGADEQHIFSAGGTANDQDPCGQTGWPADTLSPDPLMENGISILDIADFIDPVRWFDTDVADWPAGQQAGARRHDLQPGDPFALGAEINILDLAMLVEVNPAPAMLGVIRVFDTTCPWPG